MAPSRLLLRGAVELDHELVDQGLVERVLAQDLARQRVVHRRHRLRTPSAQVALLVPVAQLHRLPLAGGGAGGHGGAAAGAALEHDLGLDRGVAAAVQDLAREHGLDVAHVTLLERSRPWRSARELRVDVALLARRDHHHPAVGDGVAAAVLGGIVADHAPRAAPPRRGR